MYRFWQDNDFYKNWRKRQDNYTPKNMNKSTVEIEKEITFIERKKDELKKELFKAKFNESKVLIWNDKMGFDENCDTIGFHNFTKAKTLLQPLYDGKTLYMEHEGVGNHAVYMNPQRNRFNVLRIYNDGTHKEINSNDDSLFSEDRVESFMMGHYGTWYVVTDDFLNYLK